MTDDTTLNNAGPVGRELADTISEKVQTAIDAFPASTPQQRAAIARLIADSLYHYVEENDG